MFDQTDAQLEQGATPENNSNENNNNMASLLEQEGLGIDFPTAGKFGMVLSPASTRDRSWSAWVPSRKA